MLKVRIEIWPFGDESLKRSLATYDIWNVGGTQHIGDYEFTVKEGKSIYAEEVDVEGSVNNHARDQSATKLLYEVLKRVYE
jgi:hypothetical protein